MNKAEAYARIGEITNILSTISEARISKAVARIESESHKTYPQLPAVLGGMVAAFAKAAGNIESVDKATKTIHYKLHSTQEHTACKTAFQNAATTINSITGYILVH